MVSLMNRVDNHIETLAQYTSTQGKGITRVIYTEEDKIAKDYIKKQMNMLSLDVFEDEIGNVFGTWKGKNSNLQQVWTGSHIDAPTNGGKYDGVVGVIGALESIRILQDRGHKPQCDIVLVVFSSEEPTRFGVGCLGSRALTGGITENELNDWIDGTNRSLREVLLNHDKNPDKVLTEQLDSKRIKTFVEMHIEQGAFLERKESAIGIVNIIAAPTEIQLDIYGEQRHAGSTPMDLRKDPVPAASEVVLLIEKLTRKFSDTAVGTVGKMSVTPGTSNVIAKKVELSIDIRDIDKGKKDQIISNLEKEVSTVMSNRGLHYEWKVKSDDIPSMMDKKNLQIIELITKKLNFPYKIMSSGAYHDALIMSRKVASNLIFVPSRKGISHAPEEFTSTKEIVQGIEVLTEFLMELSKP